MQQSQSAPEAGGSNQPHPQGGSQQMVICPVRVVYETQILVPPGEQITPHQTFFVNSQNQPPWINQNNAMMPQNQMLYVQQVQPNNFVPQLQPNIEQNQIYIPQGYAMQQIMPNQNIQAPNSNNMQERPIVRQHLIQMPNVSQNINTIQMNPYGEMVMQNIQPNLSSQTQNMQNLPDIKPSIHQLQQNMNFVRSPMLNNTVRSIVMPQQPMQMQRNVQPNIINHNFAGNMSQVPSNVIQSFCPPLQTQNAVQINDDNRNQQFLQQVQTPFQPKQNNTNPTNMNRTVTSVSQCPPQQVYRQVNSSELLSNRNSNQNTAKNMAPNTRPRLAPNKAPVAVQQVSSSSSSCAQIRPRITTTAHAALLKNFQRAINIAELRPVAMLNPSTVQNNKVSPLPRQPTHITIQNTTAAKKKSKPIVIEITSTNSARETVDNRNRKSESPDEAQKKKPKLLSEQRNNPEIETKTVTSAEIGTNTSPVHRNNMKTYERKPEKDINKNTESPEKSGDKLTRNTVYSQARVRKHSNTSNDPSSSKEIKELIQSVISQDSTESADTTMTDEKPEEISTSPKDIKAPEDSHIEVTKKINKEPDVFNKIPIELDSSLCNRDKIMRLTNFMGREIELSHGNFKRVDTNNDDAYVMTHVIDGIVIQESNVAFPVRVPLKEKNMPFNFRRMKDMRAACIAENREDRIKVTTTEKQLADSSIMNISEFYLNEAKDPLKPIQDKKPEVENATKPEESGTETARKLKRTDLRAPSAKRNKTITYKLKNSLEQLDLGTEIASKLNRTESIEPSAIRNTTITHKLKNNLQQLDKPFEVSKPSEIRDWTAQQIAAQLAKKGWHETSSILRDHEIDGEALFLVSDAQLVKIGVSERHALMLYNFLKS